MNLVLPEQCVYLPIPRCGDEEISLALLGIGFVEGSLIGGDSFTIIRNPFELVRIWFELNPGWDDFSLFIKQYNHSHFAPNGLFWSRADDCIKYEELNDGALQEYLDQFDVEIQLPEMSRTDYRDMYEPETIKLVEDRFGEELDSHGYTF